MRASMLAVSAALMLSACNTTGTDSGKLVLAKSDLSIPAYQSDETACDDYVTTHSPSDAETDGGVVVGLLLGGIVGGLAASNAYQEGEYRLFEECMYGKGYQLVELPDGYHQIDLKEDEIYEVRDATKHLLAEGKMDELFVWSRAAAVNTSASYADYLARYPSGFFAERARTRLPATP